MGGGTSYTLQRYLAAKDDREAGLIGWLWAFLLSFRWPFVAAIAILGIQKGSQPCKMCVIDMVR